MEMTVTRALAELKLLDSRIHKAIQELNPIAITTGKKVVPGYQTNEEYSERTKAKLQSVKDLIKRRNEIKAAIVKSNAENKVTIGGKEYTVAEAIERKNGIKYEQELLNKLKTSYANATHAYITEDESVKKRLDILLQTAYGKDVKVTEDQYNSTAKPFLEQNAPKLIDPLNIKAMIEELEKEINDFLLNVDFELSTANSINKIAVSD